MQPMRWLESEPSLVVPIDVRIALLNRAIEAGPRNPLLRQQLGDALDRRGDLRGAVEALEIAATLAPEDFSAWASLARLYTKLGEPNAALAACDRAAVPAAAICYQRGVALRALRRSDEARLAFLSAMKLDDRDLASVKALLAPLARDPDGGLLLEFCDSLSPYCRDTALIRAHRAIAFSRLGRTEDALEIVDLDRHVARVPMPVPPPFDTITQFNAALAQEILADPTPASVSREGLDLRYEPSTSRSPALLALYAFARAAMEAYAGETAQRGLDRVQPPPPEQARLFTSNVVLRQDGRNGEHVHAQAYISGVYHVVVPDSVREAGDERGSLAVGKCETYTGGHIPCWGTRHIKPVAGWLVLFPSHFFHDVVPTRSDAPRISVAVDMRPVRPANAPGAVEGEFNPNED
ncbi:MAG TPA: putative 2OG-Fe(II) oxygenase [Rhizomicrobium sp.]|jgi:hypothetical protein|nr:putative 2OG-Fe(II) oxygenase [Rhizomicrobium sp.]